MDTKESAEDSNLSAKERRGEVIKNEAKIKSLSESMKHENTADREDKAFHNRLKNTLSKSDYKRVMSMKRGKHAKT